MKPQCLWAQSTWFNFSVPLLWHHKKHYISIFFQKNYENNMQLLEMIDFWCWQSATSTKELILTTHLLARRVVQESVVAVWVLYHLAEHADSWTDTDQAEMSTPAPLLINVIYSAFYTSPQTGIQMRLFQNKMFSYVASKSTIINAWGLSVVYFAKNRLIGQSKLM